MWMARFWSTLITLIFSGIKADNLTRRPSYSAHYQSTPAGQRNRCAGAIVQAASITVPRFLDAVSQVIRIGRVIAVLRATVVYLGCVLAIALLAAGGVGCAGRDDCEHYENASGSDRVVHNVGPSFAELVRVTQYDFGLTSVQADSSRHADALSLQRSLGRPEFRPIVSEDHRSEGRMRIRSIEVKECRLRA
jgi:hypothetical protein